MKNQNLGRKVIMACIATALVVGISVCVAMIIHNRNGVQEAIMKATKDYILIEGEFTEANDLLLDQNGQKPEEPEPGDQPGNGDPDEPSDQEPTDQPVFDTGNLDSETVIDGQTPYLDVFEEYYEEILEYLENNEVPDDLREVIEKYLEMIKNKV